MTGDIGQAIGLGLAVSALIALVFTLMLARFRAARRARSVVGAPGDPDERLEGTYRHISAAGLVDRLGSTKARTLISEPYPTDGARERPAWWYLRRRIALELTRRGELDGSILREFYALEESGEGVPDDPARVRQAVLSYMLGPARELFPFDDVLKMPPMPLSLFLICRESEEPHPVEYPGSWNWMTVAEFGKVMNPNTRLGEHFVVEPPSMARDGRSARIRFRWGTPPGVYLQDVEVRKLDETWVVHGIRDTFKLR